MKYTIEVTDKCEVTQQNLYVHFFQYQEVSFCAQCLK